MFLFSRIGRSKSGQRVPVAPALRLRARGSASLNRVPDLSDWRVGSRLVQILNELKCQPYIHRKAWEWGLCIEGLEQLGVVRLDAKALAVGAGYEGPLFYFANRIEKMIATDLYNNPQHEGKPEMLTEPWRFAPFEYRRDHLEVLRMSGDDLRFHDETFDFLFCLSSIEHFGSRTTIAKSLSEMKRVLKYDGVACIITELILQGPKHHEYFTPEEISEMFLSDPLFPLVGGNAEMTIASELLSMPVKVHDPEDLKASPHIVLTDGERLWTSFSMFLRKASR